MTCRTRSSRHAGFTLVELMVALTSSVILISAMGSLIVLTASAIPSGEDRGSLAADATLTLQRMADDASFATTITLSTSTLALEVPDRTGDSTPEPVVYWLASGGLLKRGTSTADAGAVTLLSGVTAFSCSRDSGTGVVRAVRLTLTVNGLETLDTSVETVARPAG